MKICSFDPEYFNEFCSELENTAGGRVVESLEAGVALCEWPTPATLLFCRHKFPVHSVINLETDSFQLDVLSYLQPEFDLSSLAQAPYSIQIRSSSRLPWSVGELAKAWRNFWDLPESGWSPREPEMVISGYLVPEKGLVYLGLSSVTKNLSPWSGGVCRIPRDKNSVSRAEQKLLEALELVPDLAVGKALDLGAAPGGWTRVVAELGFEVDAVDPAELDSKVEALPSVQHYQTTSGDFLSQTRGPYDLVLCDMKMDPKMVADQLLGAAKFLKDDALVVATLKLPKKGERLKACRRALSRIEKAFTVVKARQLYFNRSEVTVIAKKK